MSDERWEALKAEAVGRYEVDGETFVVTPSADGKPVSVPLPRTLELTPREAELASQLEEILPSPKPGEDGGAFAERSMADMAEFVANLPDSPPGPSQPSRVR